MQKEPLPRQDAVILEGMTSISALLNTPPQVNDRRILNIWIDQSKRRAKANEIRFLTAKSHEQGFPLSFVPAEDIDRVTNGSTHGGIVALCTDRTLPSLSSQALPPDGFYVYLDGMEDPYNFGNALRSLYAAGVNGVILPPRNWMNAAGVVAKSSAGASERLPLLVAEPELLLRSFHAAGYRILSAGIRDSVSIFDEAFRFPILLIVGGEKRGISRQLLDGSDTVVRIDYGRAFRGSLSASAACAVLAFELYRQNAKPQD